MIRWLWYVFGPKGQIDGANNYTTVAMLAIAVLLFLVIVRFRWRCGLCGKMNEGHFFRFIILACDHGGHF